VTTREDRALRTSVRSSVWTSICDWPSSQSLSCWLGLGTSKESNQTKQLLNYIDKWQLEINGIFHVQLKTIFKDVFASNECLHVVLPNYNVRTIELFWKANGDYNTLLEIWSLTETIQDSSSIRRIAVSLNFIILKIRFTTEVILSKTLVVILVDHITLKCHNKTVKQIKQQDIARILTEAGNRITNIQRLQFNEFKYLSDDWPKVEIVSAVKSFRV